MITKLSIRNFQSHKDTFLEFSPYVNAIIGPSDSGKTAIFRALRWVVENRPSGQDFHSWWGKNPAVTLGLSNGIEITRERVKAENIYRMFQQDGERGNPPQELEFKAFGQRVPDEVQRILNLSPINFQWQMDNSFLLSQSSGEVARYLNGVVNLEMIDTALLNIERRLRGEIREVQNAKQNIDKYEAEREDLKTQYSELVSQRNTPNLQVDASDVVEVEDEKTRLEAEIADLNRDFVGIENDIAFLRSSMVDIFRKTRANFRP